MTPREAQFRQAYTNTYDGAFLYQGVKGSRRILFSSGIPLKASKSLCKCSLLMLAEVARRRYADPTKPRALPLAF